ncbi:hypothetical protein NL676_017509 [Syzygium grande]|nr:hypothetical protein NL676_017509 [Syzygium grande]
MKIEGFHPDKVTFGAINGLCKNGRLEEALAYFEHCQNSRVAVNAMIYSGIDGLGKAGRVDEAEKFFEEMAEQGCSWSYCYNALMDAFTKRGKMDEALALFRKTEAEDVSSASKPPIPGPRSEEDLREAKSGGAQETS